MMKIDGKRSLPLGAISIAVSMVLAGCSTEIEEQSETIGFTSRTVVHLGIDGQPISVQTQEITLAEQRQEVAERLALIAHVTPTDSAHRGVGENQQAITHDTGCTSTDLFMFDGTSYSGHEICFFGTGTATLADYCRIGGIHGCLFTWNAAVRSFFAGNEDGYFLTPPQGFQDFDAGGFEHTADSNVANATTVTLID